MQNIFRGKWWTNKSLIYKKLLKGKIAMMVALRDGQLDIDEKRTLSTLQVYRGGVRGSAPPLKILANKKIYLKGT